jgi:hypothetical protein
MPLTELSDARTVRLGLNALALKLNGKAAAATTVSRKRAVFYNALQYAVELGQLPSNPADKIRWKPVKAAETVDPRAVINPLTCERGRTRSWRRLVPSVPRP